MTQDRQKNTTYQVMFDAADMPVYQVTAAFTKIDEQAFPGWVQFRDEDNKLVAKVRANRTLMIRRADSDPTARPAPPRPSAAPSPATAAKATRPIPASPTDLKRLSTVGSKPGAV